uniref:Uncharacterized protein n=1 Tax=Anguilla anguilla TaxID=7936 RepID=A0A0E9VSI4_ANGAN
MVLTSDMEKSDSKSFTKQCRLKKIQSCHFK